MLMLSATAYAQKFEFMQLTTIESVVPAGLGRSRMITTKPNGETEEIKLENFFSAVGINFGNVRNNDKIIADKITEFANQGWELVNTTTGVYGNDNSTGIFITRYLFKRKV